MNPAARLSIALVVGLALWWPSFTACMRGTMDLPEAAIRYLVAFLFARVAVAFLAFLQLTASVLNLMPIPGVDGGNVVYPWLSPQWRRGFDHLAPYGMLLLFAGLLWHGSAPAALVRTTQPILENLSLLFVPAGVGIIAHWRAAAGQGWQIALVLVGAAAITLLVTAWTLHLLLGRRGAQALEE